MSQPDMESFTQRILRMSDADISVLEGALKMPDSRMATSPGSANDLLWADMVVAGWMSKTVETPDVDALKSFTLLIYKIEEPGIQPISEFLQKRTHARKMAAIYNEVYPKVVTQVIEPVRSAGGSPNDMITIIAAIAAEAVNYAFAPEFREQSLENLFQKAKTRLRKV
jgi:hypothetical protein